LAIYKTLSSERLVSPTESEIETQQAELDSSKESTLDRDRDRAVEAANQMVTESVDSV